MLRMFTCTMCTLLILTVGLLAAEIKGKLKSVDVGKSTITVTVQDKDQEFKFTDDTKFVRGKKDLDREKAFKQLNKATGTEVTITTEKKDGKDVVKEVRLAGKKKQQ